MKPLWEVKGFVKHTSWKVSVLDCVFHQKMSKKSDADMYIYKYMYIYMYMYIINQHIWQPPKRVMVTPAVNPRLFSTTLTFRADVATIMRFIVTPAVCPRLS